MKVTYVRTSARGIEADLKKLPEQVTNDRRSTFSFLERNGEVFIFIAVLSRLDRTPQREKEVVEKVKAMMNKKKQEAVEEVEEFEGDESILNKLPKHAQDKIVDVYKDLDGYWIYLKKGYYFLSSEGSTEHALNLPELKKMVTKGNIIEES